MSVPLQTLIQFDPTHIPLSQKIIALCGDSATTHSLILQSLCIRAARGERLAVVVGDNHFDAYHLARRARAHDFNPAALLSCIELSRPFTCYQLHHRVCTLTRDAKSAFDALYVIGLLETFYDEDVKMDEALRLLRQTLTQLQEIAAGGLPILISIALPRQPGRETFIEIVKQAADAYWQTAPPLPAPASAQQLSLAGIL